MKTVSKLFTAAAIAFAAVACQVIDEGQIVTRQLEVTATIAEDEASKVDYAIDNNENTISPTWHINDTPDQIIGFDNNGNTFTFTVSSVSDDGKYATFSYDDTKYTPPIEGTLYAIYAPGKKDTDFKGEGSAKTLSINLASQYGDLDGDAPVLMCATATIKGGKVNFQFTNKTAIIGVKRFKLDGVSNTKVESLKLNGVITEGSFTVDETSGELKLNATGSASSITAYKESGWLTNDGICDAGVYFAAIPTKGATLSLDAYTASSKFIRVSFIENKDLEAGNYYYTSRVLEKVVAKVTVGETSTEYLTINAAFEAADDSDDDCTITLLDDCSTSSTLNIQNSNKKGAVTLDLKGKTLSCKSNSFIYVGNNRSFTITDSSSEDVADHGTIQIVGAMYVLQGNGTSTLTISGGKLSSPDRGIYVGSGSTLLIEGGEIASNNQCVCNKGTTSIKGGVFSSENTEVVISDGSGVTASVTGGYFSSKSDSELFANTKSGKCYVTGGYFDRAVSTTFTRTSNDNARSHTLNTTAATKVAYPFRVGNWKGGYPFVVTVGSGTLTYWHNNLSSAARQAKDASSYVLIQMRASTTSAQTAVNLTNDANNNITLDLAGCTLTTETSSFITTTGTALLTIKDSKTGSEKGMITSSKSKVLDLTTASATVTLNGCVIEGTKETGASFNGDPLIDMSSASGTLTINDAKIYTTAKLSVLRAYGGTTTILNSELSSGTVSEGWYVIIGANTGTVNMSSGSLYTSGTGNSSTFHLSAAGTKMTVADGCYLYSEGRVVSCYNKNYYNQVTLSGGYYNMKPSVPSSGSGQDEPSYAAGKSMQAIDPAETHKHATTGAELIYGYQVK